MNKKEVLQQGISVIDSTSFIKNERLEQLKKLIPEIVNADGQLNTQALHDFIDSSQTTSNNKGYELTFAGKGIARAMADTETTKELKVEKAQSKNFDSTEHVVIRGDNLEVLKILKQNYFEKIKMIYIDPPYNTTSENFIYNDNFKQSEEELIQNLGLGEETSNFLHNVYGTRSHSGWLAFMYPRLKLARDLLRDDGVIFISIDDNEQANLKIMCDEIFGEDNFVVDFVWQKNFAPKNDNKYISTSHENILCFAKIKDNFNINLLPREEKHDKGYNNPDNDKRGSWTSGSMLAMDPIPSLVYEIVAPNGNKHYPPKGRRWRYTKDNVKNLIEENRVWFGSEGNGVPRVKRFLSEMPKGIVPQSLLKYDDVGSGQDGSQYTKKIFDNKLIFDYPKPLNLIKRFLKIATNTNDLILDFFAGSGTTGDAVMQLNAEDGGNRKYILVQLDEKIDSKKNTEAHKFCTENNFEPVISSITIERLNRAGEKIRQEQKAKNGMFDDEKLDIGYKVFSLTEKQKIIETTQNNQSLFQLANKRTSTENTLYNMLCATRKSLDTKIQEIIKDKLYQADDELYLLSTITSEELEPYKDHKINIDGYSDISLEQWLNLDVIGKENINVVY